MEKGISETQAVELRCEWQESRRPHNERTRLFVGAVLQPVLSRMASSDSTISTTLNDHERVDATDRVWSWSELTVRNWDWRWSNSLLAYNHEDLVGIVPTGIGIWSLVASGVEQSNSRFRTSVSALDVPFNSDLRTESI